MKRIKIEKKIENNMREKIQIFLNLKNSYSENS